VTNILSSGFHSPCDEFDRDPLPFAEVGFGVGGREGRFLGDEGSILTVPVIHDDSPVCMCHEEERLGRGHPTYRCTP
jgi:hypothetical protein